MRTCFLCAINNEAVLKAAFKAKEHDLTFQNVVLITTEVEAAKTAKAHVYYKLEEVHNVSMQRPPAFSDCTSENAASQANGEQTMRDCGRRNHTTDKCRFRNAECNFCKKKGHIEAACRTKQAAKVKYIILINTVRQQDTPQVQVLVTQNGIQHPFLVDTGARSNLISLAWWKAIGKPPIQDITAKYRSATRHPIPILGTVRVDSSLLGLR